MTMGIYSITNLVNDKRYIGFSSNIEKRFYDHKSFLAAHKHDNKYLERAWFKYGALNFVFEILETCDDASNLGPLEIAWISKLKTNIRAHGYNLTEGGDGIQGYKHTEESKSKMSKVKLGRKLSAETKTKMSKTRKGRTSKRKNREFPDEIRYRRAVNCLDFSNNLIKIYESIRSVAEDGFDPTHVLNCCNKIRKSHRKLHWEFNAIS